MDCILRWLPLGFEKILLVVILAHIDYTRLHHGWFTSTKSKFIWTQTRKVITADDKNIKHIKNRTQLKHWWKLIQCALTSLLNQSKTSKMFERYWNEIAPNHTWLRVSLSLSNTHSIPTSYATPGVSVRYVLYWLCDLNNWIRKLQSILW